ncbi:C6 transcription factor [Colletotrichum chrysophilum]|uniref:C6 transcription factor n=1 Tax=Colletotrichum chrysophilum TaxID=1836956 RepID=A0AAD9EFS7_9PEZI|nr:C6 transcription factor [Colletotrichum chrysophilum]
MACKASRKSLKPGKPSHQSNSPTLKQLTTSTVRDDPALGYKLRVLLFDLRNLAKDVNSAKRLNSTTDEHYISEPYFEPEQAKVVKSAIVDVEFNNHLDPNAEHEKLVTDEPRPNDEEVSGPAVSRVRGQTVDTAIRMIMDNFLEKRKGSGDARPCGPHDLAPVYLGLFGMTVANLQDHKFISRLARSGV